MILFDSYILIPFHFISIDKLVEKDTEDRVTGGMRGCMRGEGQNNGDVRRSRVRGMRDHSKVKRNEA